MFVVDIHGKIIKLSEFYVFLENVLDIRNIVLTFPEIPNKYISLTSKSIHFSVVKHRRKQKKKKKN